MGLKQLTRKEKKNDGILSDESVLKIGNLINGMSQHLNQVQIKTPRMVVVGTQSSGKSTLLNRIIGADLLPTGNQIVTRTPLSLELSPTTGKPLIEFGQYQEGLWSPIESYSFKFPNPSDEEKRIIREQIQTQTVNRAGKDMGISQNPIYIRIFAENLPNLTLVDLPGLTMVACTDRGQPKNIKEQIRLMVKEYITPPETIILAVMAARTDLETDLALDLVKEVDPEGQRTVGIITKLDLMGQKAHIGHYLENEISRDLQLAHGYFGVVNLDDETTFFKEHPVYRQERYSERLGIRNLASSLSKILVTQIRNYLPQILQQVKEKLVSSRERLSELGAGVPESPEGKSALIHQIYSSFIRRFHSVLNDRGHSVSTARKIKNILVKYRQEIQQMDPFSEKNFPSGHLKTIIENCEGNHMSFPVPAVEVLEQSLRDSKYRPIYHTSETSLRCLEDIRQELITLTNHLADSRFDNLNKLIKTEMINRLISERLTESRLKIMDIYHLEHSYIWTDDQSFLEAMNTKDVNIRNLIRGYYLTIIRNLQHNIPKIIMHQMIEGLCLDLHKTLYDVISRQKMDNLLEESNDSSRHRQRLSELCINLEKIHEEIESVMSK